MKTLCAKANVPYFRFHPLRHAGASLMDAANIPLAAIQHILGHENRKTTELYIYANEKSHTWIMKSYEQARKKISNPEDAHGEAI